MGINSSWGFRDLKSVNNADLLRCVQEAMRTRSIVFKPLHSGNGFYRYTVTKNMPNVCPLAFIQFCLEGAGDISVNGRWTVDSGLDSFALVVTPQSVAFNAI